MANSRPLKGTELRTKRTLVPGAEYGTGQPTVEKTIGVPAAPAPPVTPVEDVDWGVITLTAKQGFARNLTGNPITDYDLANSNSAFSFVIALSYPGGSGDDNDIQWECPIDTMMDLTDPQISVRLHFLIPSYTRPMLRQVQARATLSKV